MHTVHWMNVMETQQIFEQLQKMYEAGAPEAFRPYPLQYKVKKQSPATPQQMKYLKQFVEFHGIPMPEIYEDASRSENLKAYRSAYCTIWKNEKRTIPVKSGIL